MPLWTSSPERGRSRTLTEEVAPEDHLEAVVKIVVSSNECPSLRVGQVPRYPFVLKPQGQAGEAASHSAALSTHWRLKEGLAGVRAIARQSLFMSS